MSASPPRDPPSEAERLRRALLALRGLRARVEELESARNPAIAIVGMGCRFPGGASDPDRFWERLCEGFDGIVDIPSQRMPIDEFFDPEGDPDLAPVITCRRAGLLADVDSFDHGFFRMSPREARSLDPQHRLVLEVAWEALERAAIAPANLAGSRTGIVLGITLSDHDHLVRQAGPSNIDTYHLSGNCLSFAAGRIAYLLGLHGPTLVLDTACSSSLVSVHLACQALRTGEADLMLAGGVNVILSPDGSIMVSKMRMISKDGYCKTFDAAADGFVRGEGCGVVVLKRLADAQRDGDPVVAVLRSSAVNQDGASSGLTVPNGRAQRALMKDALERAGVSPQDVGYLECHGTGTSLGDPIEVSAIADTYAAQRSRGPLRLGSVKTNFGHLESASGIAGLIKAALVVQHGEVPAHRHLRRLNPDLSLRGGALEIPTERVPWNPALEPRIAGVSSFGASGTNAHVLLEQPPPRAEAPALRATVPTRGVVLPLSARSDSALREMARRFAAHLRGPVRLDDVCYTAAIGRNAFEHRLALRGMDAAEMADRLEAFARGESPADLHTGEVPSERPGVVFLFPGQGAQYPGMGLELYEQVEAYRAALDECRAFLDEELEQPLLELLRQDLGSDSPLHRTHNTQPAIFAVEYALARTWLAFGLRPSALLGHSIGEYTAACLSGILDLESACRMIAARGRLMQDLCPPGAMAAIFADEIQVREALRGREQEASIAALNGPRNVVVSGTESAVEQIVQHFSGQGVSSKRLTVSHAFHSPLMEPMLDEFRAVVEGARFGEPSIPVLSNRTGAELDARTAADPEYWCSHVREAVRFTECARRLGERGEKLFLEVGPGSTLIGLVQQVLPAASSGWVASLRRGRSEWPQLLDAVAGLVVGGAKPSFEVLLAGRGCSRIVLPTYPFERHSQHRRLLQESRGDGTAARLLARRDAEGLVRWLRQQGGWSAEEETALPRLVERLVAAAVEQANEDPASGSSVLARLDELPADARTRTEAAWAALRRQIEEATAAVRADLLTEHVQNTMAELLGFGAEPPDPRRGFLELGVDSLMSVTLRGRLEASLGVHLPVTFLFDHPNIEALVGHLLASAFSSPSPREPRADGSRAQLVEGVRALDEEQVADEILRQLRDLGLS